MEFCPINRIAVFRVVKSFIICFFLVCHLAIIGCDSASTSSQSESVNVGSATSDQLNPPSDDDEELAPRDERPKRNEGETLAAIDLSLNVEALLSRVPPRDQMDLGWIELFDGQSLFGWSNQGSANWRVENGQIIADAGETGLLTTNTRFADFELMVEYYADAKTNSGVFLRTESHPSNPGTDCFELNIAPPENPFPTGSLVNMNRVETSISESLDSTQWHTFNALVDSNRMQIWLDGDLIHDLTLKDGLNSGLIGLQYREGPIRFRRIALRPILYDSVLPAKNLDRWQAEEDSSAEFMLTDQGALVIQGGRGFIELLQPLDDFCMQFQAQALSENANSGVFFRCIPTEAMNGYECQFNQGFLEDRRRPADCGTGGIFRRQNARLVVGEADESVNVTLVADGNRFASWVNGIQVVDFVDDREFNSNPRLGRRDEEGTIMLQGHDPDCKVKFSRLRVMPIRENALNPQ